MKKIEKSTSGNKYSFRTSPPNNLPFALCKFALFPLLLAALAIPGLSQCPTGNLELYSQYHVDNFKVFYPGCKVIEGDLIIESKPDIHNLDSLDEITTVRGALRLVWNDSLLNLDGLKNLDSLGGYLAIFGNPLLASISGLSKLTKVPGELNLGHSPSLPSLAGLENLTEVGGQFYMEYSTLTPDLSALSNLQRLDRMIILGTPGLSDFSVFSNLAKLQELYLQGTSGLINLDGLQGIDTLGGITITNAPNLLSLKGLENVKHLGGLTITQCENLVALDSLKQLNSIGNIHLSQNQGLANVAGLSSLKSLLTLEFSGMPALGTLNGLENLESIGDLFSMQNLPALTSISALQQIQHAPGQLALVSLPSLDTLEGLQNLETVGNNLFLHQLPLVTSLAPLAKLKKVGDNLEIADLPALTDIAALAGLQELGVLYLNNNFSLTDCAVASICRKIKARPDQVYLISNGPGCNDIAEIAGQCSTFPVRARVLVDADGDCLENTGAKFSAPDAAILVENNFASELKPCDASGLVHFEVFEKQPLTLSVQRILPQNWEVCQDSQMFDPANLAPGDTLRADFLLRPIRNCAELETRLALPDAFPVSVASQEVSVSVRNVGFPAASSVNAAVVLPFSGFDILNSVPSPSGQSGDTLYFDLGDLAPFATGTVRLEIRGKSAALDRSFCWEAFADAANTCAVAPQTGSEIRISAECAGDSVVFTLKNIGDAATQAPHEYRIVQNQFSNSVHPFSLASQQTLQVKVPANGSTWRLEATRRNDGSRTATAIEGCGGLRPGQLADFWYADQGSGHDFACTQVTAAPFLNDYPYFTAFPGGGDFDNYAVPGQTIRYTLHIQNHGSDTLHEAAAFSAIAPGFDPESFQPIGSSHPFNWSIRNGNQLEVQFPDADLPPLSTNPAAAQAFFTYELRLAANPGTGVENRMNVVYNQTPHVNVAYNHLVSDPQQRIFDCTAVNGVQISSQLDADLFSRNYTGCLHITGGMRIQGYDLMHLKGLGEVESVDWLEISACQPLADLDGLSSLASVGYFNISGNPDLKSVNGLNRLKSIGDKFSITFHEKLDTIDGFEQLDTIGGTLEISLNQGLKAIKGFENLDSVGNIYVVQNPFLKKISGFNNLKAVKSELIFSHQDISELSGFSTLESVGGNFVLDDMGPDKIENFTNLREVGGDFQVSSLYRLDTLRRFDRLEKVGGSFRLYNSPYLVALGDFEKLRSVGGNFEIYRLHSIYNFSQFENLDTIGGDFLFSNNHACGDLAGFAALRDVDFMKIDSCNSLQNISGFNQLHAIGGLELTQNPELLSLGGFTALDSIRHFLIVQHNPALLDVAGLSNLKHIGASAYFLRNRVIQLDHFDNLRYIGNRLDVEGNLFLSNLDGFPLLDSMGQLNVVDNYSLASIGGFEQLKKLSNGILVKKNSTLQNIESFGNLLTVGGSIRIDSNQNLLQLEGFKKLKTIGNDLYWGYNPKLKSVADFGALDSIGRDFLCYWNDALDTVSAFASLHTIGRDLSFQANGALKDPTFLDQLQQVEGTVWLGPYNGFTHLQGLDSLKKIGKNLRVYLNFFLEDLSGMNNLESVGGEFSLEVSLILKKVSGLKNLKTVGASLYVDHAPMLQSLEGLQALQSIGGRLLLNRTGLFNLYPLKNVTSIGNGIQLYQNYALEDISALAGILLEADDSLHFQENYRLSDCSIASICHYLDANPSNVFIQSNKTGCSSVGEVQAQCMATPVQVRVLWDKNSDCQVDPDDVAVGNIQVHLEGDFLKYTKPSDAGGVVPFRYYENGAFTLSLPQFPTAFWQPCTAEINLTPGSNPLDTLFAFFLLKPAASCPQLETDLTLPSNFRSCLVVSDIGVLIQNSGAELAENTVCTVVLPSVLELLETVPLPSGTQGDSIFFNLGDLRPFEKAPVKLKVRTRCDTFLFGHTLCIESFSELDNPCPTTGLSSSEIKITPVCLGDTLIRFTLKNIGDAPTLAPHTYRIFRNGEGGPLKIFSLVAQQALDVDIPADGATYRMEATKRNDGTLTAAAFENCGGLTPGLITAFWLDEGDLGHDFDCRLTIGSYDPNLKSAVPTGVGPDNLLPSNQPLVYTIDFQNTGTDTAFRVLLRDVLPKQLDLTSFRPMASSHPCSWQLVEGNTLEVLFSPISLPDSNVNEPASHGFFTFEINQLPDLPLSTVIENTVGIIFDFNPPIITNTVRHTIGKLTVRVDEPERKEVLWEVLGNPTSDKAVFQAKSFIDGQKRFELYDAVGKLYQMAEFSGQTFEFQRDGLPSGLYLFSIRDEQGRVFAGRVVVAD